MRTFPRNLAIRCLLLLAWIAVVGFRYEQTAPRLANPDRAARLKQVRAWLASSENGSRPVVAVGREFFLDYPDAREPDVRLKLALQMAAVPGADLSAAADEVERAALAVLAGFGPGRTPTRKDFEKVGFRFDHHYAWPASFLVTDFDGDGRPDVLFATPGEEPSVAYLFRHTATGWTGYRFGLGVPVLGLQTLDITPHGPKAVVLMSLTDSEYAPNMLFDVFAWEHGALRDVLSTVIEKGWQWNHDAQGGDGTQQIHLYAHPAPVDFDDSGQAVVTTYRWNGSEYIKTPMPTKPRGGTVDWLEAGKRLFAAGKLPEARTAFRNAVGWSPDRTTYHYTGYDPYGYWSTWYRLGLCEALLGNRAGAVQAMTQVGGAEPDIWQKQRAALFLRTCAAPSDLPRALAAVGQVFRLLDVKAGAAPASASPRDILKAAGCALDRYQTLPSGAAGRPQSPAAVCAIHWNGGSAVLAWQRAAPAGPWTYRLLAYGLLQPVQVPEYYVTETDDLFYLSQTPVLQPYPPLTDVRLDRVSSTPASVQVGLSGRRQARAFETVVEWREGEFVVEHPASQASDDLLDDLDRIEAILFDQKDYRAALAAFRTYEQRVRSSSAPTESKNDLLRETYYHEAICYRKLGQGRRAAITLAGLEPGLSDRPWSALARDWLQ